VIREVERMHGAVLARLVREGSCVRLRSHDGGRSAYVVDERVAVYIKYSTSRMSPWSFSFSREQQEELRDLGEKIESVCIVLVCGEDGMVSLTESELREVLDDRFEEVEWVRASRRRGGQYGVAGSDGRLRLKVADNAFPEKVFALLSRPCSCRQ
jgi:hypothetical protein